MWNAYSSLYRITGNTYRNRAWIRELGASWNADLKAWEIRAGGNGWTDTIWKLRRSGCKVERVG